MQVDKNPFPVNTIELQNPKVLIRPNQANGVKWKNVIISAGRPKPLEKEKKLSPESSLKSLALEGQDKDEVTGSAKTGLTGFSRNTRKSFKTKKKTRPSFEELMAKYKKQGAT